MATAPNQPEVFHIPLPAPEETTLALPTPTPMMLLQQAIVQGVSIEQLERLQLMCERWEANQARKAYYAAKNAFKLEAPTILKNKHVKIEPKDTSKRGAEYDHATLDHVCDQVIPLLAKHHLSHDWKTEQKGFKNPIQMIASTVTYLERYTLLMVCGLAAKGTDNDGRGVTIEAGLSEKRVDQLGQAIANANTLDELKTVYFAAYREAEKAKHTTAKQLFMQTAAARKRELQ